MIINSRNLALVYEGFKSVYTDAYLEAPVDWDKIAMTVPSSGAEETYGWLGQFPQLREWIGPRVVKNLAAHAFAIRNRKFESTVRSRATTSGMTRSAYSSRSSTRWDGLPAPTSKSW